MNLNLNFCLCRDCNELVWSYLLAMAWFLSPSLSKKLWCYLQPTCKENAYLCRGCKFSAEEERIVIELQAKFGNKWAKIATYLEGRTDNDVKNFWSTRRKRLERILQTPTQKCQKNKQRISEPERLHELPALEVKQFDIQVKMEYNCFLKLIVTTSYDL